MPNKRHKARYVAADMELNMPTTILLEQIAHSASKCGFAVFPVFRVNYLDMQHTHTSIKKNCNDVLL